MKSNDDLDRFLERERFVAYYKRYEEGRMPTLDRETYEDWSRAYAIVTAHEHTLRAALEQRRDFFREESEKCRQLYEAGAGNEPETVGPNEVSVLITNNGYRVTAELFGQQADAADRALRALNVAIDPEYYDEDEGDNE